MSTGRRGYEAIKRAFDVTGAAAGLIVTLPIQLAVAGLLRVCLGSPVLFRQERPGKNARIFTMVKFRTMREPDPAAGLVTDSQRLTALGRVLRATSLDELPALWNVFRGDMSLVGPRPLLTTYLPLYSPEQARRHEVRPGITGLAQVGGRNELPWDERFRLDVKYVEKMSLGLDLRILRRTFTSVLQREGISAEGHVTMRPFAGNSGTLDNKNEGKCSAD